MNVSSANPVTPLLSVADATLLAARLLKTEVADFVPQSEGRNNAVYRATTHDGRSFAFKTYPVSVGDTRDRLGAEFKAFQFLGEQGVKAVPAAITCSPADHAALYEWIDGAPVDTPTAGDIDQAAAFAATLATLRDTAADRDFAMASQACLSADEIADQVRARIDHLRDKGRKGHDLDDILAAIEHGLARAAAFARRGYQALGLDPAQPLTRTRQVLSPSDFGFHNALRRRDGSLVFLDFEYFGWDDPAKLVIDFRLHPGMNLPQAMADRFLDKALDDFQATEPHFRERVHLLESLYCLRWACIVLNPFLETHWIRWIAAGETRSRQQILDQQAEKAHKFIARANDLSA